MFAEQAFELIKELERNPENLPPFNVRNSLNIFVLSCILPVSHTFGGILNWQFR